MPFYDFFCKKCNILIEDEFFKIADEKNDKYEDLKNEKIMLGSFKTLEDAKVFICEIERA